MCFCTVCPQHQAHRSWRRRLRRDPCPRWYVSSPTSFDGPTDVLPISFRVLFTDFSANQLQSLISELATNDFDAYLAAVGGSGLGILSPYNHGTLSAMNPGAYTGPITPPETPEEGLEGKTLREQFTAVGTEKFAQWADGRGRWLFV